MKRTLAVICAALLVLSLSACGQRVPDYALGTVWGEIAEINGTKVTLTLGEISGDGGASGGDFTPPDSPTAAPAARLPKSPTAKAAVNPAAVKHRRICPAARATAMHRQCPAAEMTKATPE